MKNVIGYLTLSSFSKICFMAKGAKTFTKMDYILFDHMKIFPHAMFLSLRMHNPWIERNVCVLLG
jgi:hypothetical protein